MKNIISLVISIALIVTAIYWPTSPLVYDGSGNLDAGEAIESPEEFLDVYKLVYSNLALDRLASQTDYVTASDIKSVTFTEERSERVEDFGDKTVQTATRDMKLYIADAERYYEASGEVKKEYKSSSKSSDRLVYDFEIYVGEDLCALKVNALEVSGLNIKSSVFGEWMTFPIADKNDLVSLIDYDLVEVFDIVLSYSMRFTEGEGKNTDTHYRLSDEYKTMLDTTVSLDFEDSKTPRISFSIITQDSEESIEVNNYLDFMSINSTKINIDLDDAEQLDSIEDFVMKLGG